MIASDLEVMESLQLGWRNNVNKQVEEYLRGSEIFPSTMAV